MMKYILCILFSILLVGGFKFVSITHDLQVPQVKTGVVDTYTKSASFVSNSIDEHIPIHTGNFSDSNANYNLKDGILCNAFISQCNIPSKILKFNATNLMMHLLSSQDSPLHDSHWRTHYSNSNYIKYSNGYYVYTLGHILI